MKTEMKQWLEAARALRERLLSDFARPKYHFACPEDDGNPGDPNAAFYAGGRYHLMFLYRCCSDSFRYGHISSPDLIHWERHPDTLIPDELDGGIFSGGAYVDDDGTVYVSYWALAPENSGRNSGIRIAFSKDLDNNYELWQKFNVDAVKATESGVCTTIDSNGDIAHLAAADPSNIWKKGDYYYMQAGNLTLLNAYGRQPDSDIKYRGDFTDLYRSKDMRIWEYVHRFYERRSDNIWTDESEDNMCPSFLPLPKSENGGELSDKYLQLFIAHNKGCQYYIGTYDENNDRFIPEKHGRMSWLDNHYFAPEALLSPDGRQIMWAWIKENRQNEVDRFGWSAVYGVPRSLWLNEDGELGIAPIRELNTLRCNEGDKIDGLRSSCCEIMLEADVENAEKAGVSFYMSDDGQEYSRFYYDAVAGELVYEARHPGSELESSIERAPFKLKPGETLKLNVYIDHSVVEAFANDRQAIGRRVYPIDKHCNRISVYNCGKINIISERTWDIAPVNPY